MASVSASNTGTGPLVVCTVMPFARQNSGVRGVAVQCLNGSTVVRETGFRLGTRHLLAPDATGSRNYRAAVRDQYGVWSEWGDAVAFSGSNFSAGSTDASIGSGATSGRDLQDPGIVFPDPAMGSAVMRVFATRVGPGFLDETRAPQWSRPRWAFRVVYDGLGEEEVKLLRRLYRDVGGTRDAFFFDFVQPQDGTRTTAPAGRYVVKFRDASLGDRLVGHDLWEASFTLAEVQDDPAGGDV